MIIPNRGLILIEIIDRKDTTKSGLHVPTSAKEDPNHGKVLAIGRPWLKEGGLVEDPPKFDILDDKGMPVKQHKLQVGDIILFKNYTIHETSATEKTAFVTFDSILSIDLPDKETKK